MIAPARPRTAEEQTFWELHREYLDHMHQTPPCDDCVRGSCRTAIWLDEAADEADRAWGRKTGGWW